jgi:hypothetical protein
MEVGIIQWKYGARQTISLLFHPSGRKRLTEGSNVALHRKKVGDTNNNLKVGIYNFKYLHVWKHTLERTV